MSPVQREATLTDAEFAMVREGMGFTRSQIAARLGVSVQTIGHWESGKYAVPKGVGVELEELEGRWIGTIEALAAHMRDARESVLAVPRGGADGFPPGWHRSIAHQVTLRDPSLTVEYADGHEG